MKVLALGLRGFPGVQGGVEAHAERLYPLLVNLGCDVEVVVRAPYVPIAQGSEWQGITFRRIWSPRLRGLEAIVHTFLGVLYAAMKRPDVLHIHAIGPALMTPLARLFGLRIVVTHHGPDYERQKWGRFSRWVLRTGERVGMRYATQRIVISEVIRQLVRRNYAYDSILIPNGVTLLDIPKTTTALEQFGLEPGRYVLMVGRLVPEKRHLDLIKAFAMAAMQGWKLVLVGTADHPDNYMRDVVNAAAATPNVVMAGFQTGLALEELYAHAGIFVLPSSHEGLPIVLLEALSYGLPVIASDISANLEIGLKKDQYFPLGETTVLARRLKQTAHAGFNAEDKKKLQNWVMARYDWARIAKQTMDVYRLAVE